MPRDGALARSSAELTSHPENRELTELAANPLARATNPRCLPLLSCPTILPHAAFPRRPLFLPTSTYLPTYPSEHPPLPSSRCKGAPRPPR